MLRRTVGKPKPLGHDLHEPALVQHDRLSTDPASDPT
jgi:hypothetical protein